MCIRSQVPEESLEKSKLQSMSPRKNVKKSILENASAMEKIYYSTKLGQSFLNAINKANELDDHCEEIVENFDDEELWAMARRQGGLSVKFFLLINKQQGMGNRNQ
jgi:hypothetical protein